LYLQLQGTFKMGVYDMKNWFFFIFLVIFLLIPLVVFPVTLVRVGYIDLDFIIKTYTGKYIETEIFMRDDFTRQLQNSYNTNYYTLSESEKRELQQILQEQRSVLNMLRYNQYLWDNTEEIRDEVIYHIVQRDIMEAIKKTSELEGFNLILDNTGNFVYGSEDINLTDKVFFRLDEKLLDLQNKDPLTPLSLELGEVQNGSEYLSD